MYNEKFISSEMNDSLCKNKTNIRWVFGGCQFRKKASFSRSLLDSADLFQRSFKHPVEEFIVGDSAAQDFADVFDVFDIND